MEEPTHTTYRWDRDMPKDKTRQATLDKYFAEGYANALLSAKNS